MGRRVHLDYADAIMLGVVLIWGANNVFVKAVLNEVDPLAYVFARFTIVVVLLLAWLAFRRQLVWPERRDWPQFLLVAVSRFALYNVLFTVGFGRTTAFSVALLVLLGPVFALCFATLLGIERARGGQWLSAAVAVTGVAVFVGDKLLGGLPA